MSKDPLPVTPPAENALLVGATLKSNKSGWSIESSMAELTQLANTAGVDVVGQVVQRLDKISRTHYLGSGKLKELVELQSELQYDVAIFDDELSPKQQRNLEDALSVKVIDRTALILDIFARHAYTKEGQLQVELAQYEYLLPRVAGQWTHLDRLRGGIGMRGVGETQIETDRRLIRKKIGRLKTQIEQLRKHRHLYQENRKRSGISVVAIVGYTNTGKSTLLNALTNANVLVEDKLFATLDPITRRMTSSDRQQILMTDTVGFIQKLPHTLVTAFRATLEELTEADMLLHVLDITHTDTTEQYQTVEHVLSELGVADTQRLIVANKVDLCMNKDEVETGIRPQWIDQQQPLLANHPIVLVSAAKGWGLDRLREEISGAVLCKGE